MNQLQQ